MLIYETEMGVDIILQMIDVNDASMTTIVR